VLSTIWLNQHSIKICAPITFLPCKKTYTYWRSKVSNKCQKLPISKYFLAALASNKSPASNIYWQPKAANKWLTNLTALLAGFGPLTNTLNKKQKQKLFEDKSDLLAFSNPPKPYLPSPTSNLHTQAHIPGSHGFYAKLNLGRWRDAKPEVNKHKKKVCGFDINLILK
jgi:hypothetical protein